MYIYTHRYRIYQAVTLSQFPYCGKLIDIKAYPATACTCPT